MAWDVGSPGRSLLALAGEAQSRLMIVAPFVKRHAMQRVLEHTPDAVQLCVVTRWHLLELLNGVSDIEVWPLLRDRGDSLHLVPRLHAKIFANESDVLVGSANVTGAALGWSALPNDEVLVHPSSDEVQAVRDFAAGLRERSVEVDDATYLHYADLLASFPRPTVQPEELELPQPEPQTPTVLWLPESRDPQDVERLYEGATTMLTSSAHKGAARDLVALDVPPGLSLSMLRAHINLQLTQHPLVSYLRDHLVERRRFGEVAQLVGKWAHMERDDANNAWQTLMRWLLHFQPAAWTYGKPRHSEILIHIGKR
jgi:hypothetical protein